MGPTIGCPDCGARITPEEIMAGVTPLCCADDAPNRPRRPKSGTPERVRDRLRRLGSAVGGLVPIPA